MYTDNDIMFPRHVIDTLKELRGAEWRALIERVVSLPEMHEETLAFMLMMIRLNGCMTCETDSYRAMRGCTACTHQVLRRFKGTDAELIEMYQTALKDVRTAAYKQDSFRVLMPTTSEE